MALHSLTDRFAPQSGNSCAFKRMSMISFVVTLALGAAIADQTMGASPATQTATLTPATSSQDAATLERKRKASDAWMRFMRAASDRDVETAQKEFDEVQKLTPEDSTRLYMGENILGPLRNQMKNAPAADVEKARNSTRLAEAKERYQAAMRDADAAAAQKALDDLQKFGANEYDVKSMQDTLTKNKRTWDYWNSGHRPTPELYAKMSEASGRFRKAMEASDEPAAKQALADLKSIDPNAPYVQDDEQWLAQEQIVWHDPQLSATRAMKLNVLSVRREREKKISDAYGEFYKALNSKDWAKAEQALAEVKKLNPNEVGLSSSERNLKLSREQSQNLEAELQLRKDEARERKEKADKISAATNRFSKALTSQDWKGAEKAMEELKKIDPNDMSIKFELRSEENSLKTFREQFENTNAEVKRAWDQVQRRPRSISARMDSASRPPRPLQQPSPHHRPNLGRGFVV